MIRKFLLPAALAAAAFVSLPARAHMGVYTIDPTHSAVSFKVRHFFSKVPGKFDKFAGTIKFDQQNWAASSVDVSIETASINTSNEGRDKHLRSPDFFDAAKYPVITFHSTKIEALDATHLRITGDFTMHGVTKPVVLNAEYTGSGPGPQGVKLAGFTATTKIDRQDFGVAWNHAVEGTNVLGDDIEIEISVEADMTPPPVVSAPASSPVSSPAPAKMKKKKKKK